MNPLLGYLKHWLTFTGQAEVIGPQGYFLNKTYVSFLNKAISGIVFEGAHAQTFSISERDQSFG